MCKLNNLKNLKIADIDIGFAFLERFGGKGYAYEAANETMAYAKNTLNLTRIVAITNPDNHRSIKLLNRLGLQFEKMVKLTDNAPELQLLVWSADK